MCSCIYILLLRLYALPSNALRDTIIISSSTITLSPSACAACYRAPVHMQAGGFASNHQDLASSWTPMLFGLTNACASLAGTVGVYAVGALLDWTGSWSLVLTLIAGANVASAAVYMLLASSVQVFD